MKNLTRIEEIAIAVALLSLLFVIGLVASVATINITVITTVLLLVTGILFIVIAHALDNERAKKATIKGYNELRKQVLITSKFDVHTLNELNDYKHKSLTYMVCSRAGKSKFCHECKHRDVHLWCAECEETGCEPTIRIQQ